MLWILLSLGLGLIIFTILADMEDLAIGTGIFEGVILVVALVMLASYNSTKATADKQIAVLEQRNDEVVSQIEPLVRQYLEYESSTYKELKPNADTLIALANYPELKGNEFVQTQIQVILENQKKISAMQNHVISGLANLIENRDTDTGGHISRTSAYVKKLSEFAREDGVYTEQITDHFITLMYTLAPMHDIGKILVPDNILKKPGRLTAEEFEQMKKHASLGGKVVSEVLDGITNEEYLAFASDIASGHHEKWDGNGYPFGLKGEQIPLPARIMAIADVFDALISRRCYKEAMPVEQAFEVIREGAGTHFDPNLVQVFLNHRQDFCN